MSKDTCLPTSVWFLSDEHGRPLGQIYRPDSPQIGDEITGANTFVRAEIIAFEELRPTCASRRFKVVLRI